MQPISSPCIILSRSNGNALSSSSGFLHELAPYFCSNTETRGSSPPPPFSSNPLITIGGLGWSLAQWISWAPQNREAWVQTLGQSANNPRVSG